MRIFIRMIAICWIVMLLLTTAVVFWPTDTSPMRGDRQRTIPMLLLQSCATEAAEEHGAATSGSALQKDANCPAASLVASSDEAKADMAGHQLTRDELRVVHRAYHSRATAVRFMADGTIIAFEAAPALPQSPIYLTTLPLPDRSLLLWRLGRAGRLIFISGLLSFLVAAYFVRPVTRLRNVAEQFGKGDLKARVSPLLARRKDELGDLGKAFNGMADRIESLVARYKSFLAHASHELGSPITRLNIALALARRKGGPALEQEHNRIRQEADRLNSLVQELLLLARLESGNELGRQQVDFGIGPVVQEAFENARFEGQQVDKSVAITLLQEFTVHGYPDMLLRAIDNVLRNGLRFARKQVRVQVTCAKKQTATTGLILIEDDGPGIAMEDEESIFEPFFTGAGNLDSDAPYGSGLGLAIAKQAAIANGGRIFARKSTLGGLMLAIELPATISEIDRQS